MRNDQPLFFIASSEVLEHISSICYFNGGTGIYTDTTSVFFQPWFDGCHSSFISKCSLPCYVVCASKIHFKKVLFFISKCIFINYVFYSEFGIIWKVYKTFIRKLCTSQDLNHSPMVYQKFLPNTCRSLLNL